MNCDGNTQIDREKSGVRERERKERGEAKDRREREEPEARRR